MSYRIPKRVSYIDEQGRLCCGYDGPTSEDQWRAELAAVGEESQDMYDSDEGA